MGAAPQDPAQAPRWILAVGVLLAALTAAWVAPLPARLDAPGSPELRYADGSEAHVLLSPDDKWRIPVRLAEIDPAYLEALRTVEDARFDWHFGVDPLAVGRAAVDDALAGRVVSGASTLTMQLARMLEPRPRTLRSKAIEAARAVQLEAHLTKAEILESYLTFLPFGLNVEGVQSASLWYFGHDARALSPPEIAALLAVPQDPTHRYPSPANAERLRAARHAIAARIWTEGDTLGTVDAAPLPERIARPPRHAPHAARWMEARTSGGTRVDSTLDAGAQKLAERLVANVREAYALQGIHDVAVVVLETRSAEVRALVGGTDFRADRSGAQIAAFDEPRSPGSTLKPLLYAAGIDAGLLLPDRLVEDLPARFGGYAPANYDGRFHGMVPAEEALSRSLNLPFVNLLSRYGVEAFLGKLRGAGLRHLDPRPGHYGLSLIVGGTELTPMELAGLYAALAGDGSWRAPEWRADHARSAGLPLTSPGAAWLTRRALRLRDRPDFPERARWTGIPRAIHWKTGTSFGNRDAWAVGSGERYTAVIWLGNLDNTPSSHLVGAEAAAPLLFDLLDGLGDGRTTEDPAPADIRPVEVCALSGHLPGEACPDRRTVPALAARVPPDRCELHVRAEVDADSGLAVTAQCTAPHRRETRTFVRWPAGAQRWLGQQLFAAATLPPPAADCLGLPRSTALRIRSPGADEVTRLIPGMAATRQQVPLEADGEGEIAWYVDGAYVQSAPAGTRAWWTPRPGVHVVVAMDASGRTASRSLDVE